MGRISVAFLLLTLISSGVLWEAADSAKISCRVCKEFVISFHKRLDATANSNYAGGDTSWEEENLGSYSNSEVRLVEILDTVCKKSDYSCHGLLEEAEEDIEKWWFKLRKLDENRDLRSWLCYAHLDVCCPENTFGPSCDLCPGAPNDTCGGRGKCEGVEEKDGSGVCTCDKGYSGDMCQSCDTHYYQEEEEEEGEEGMEGQEDEEVKPLICKECDESCAGSCDGPGSADCHECADGYKESDAGACEDVDECKMDGDMRCKEGTYCYNTPGSFRCNDCDKACKKICNGPGPVKCAECATGYTRNEHGVCRDDDECENGTAKCDEGTYCENTPGKYACKACHVSCLSGCHGAGVKGCVACKEGYVMSVEEGCEDINECEDDPPPCDVTTETCSNLLGSYQCKCQLELVRGEEGRCISREERDAQRQARKEKKKKKKKKKKEAEPRAATSSEGERTDLPSAEAEGGGEKEKVLEPGREGEGGGNERSNRLNTSQEESNTDSSSQEAAVAPPPKEQEATTAPPTEKQEATAAPPTEKQEATAAPPTEKQEAVTPPLPEEEQEVDSSKNNRTLPTESDTSAESSAAKSTHPTSPDTRDEL